MKRIGNFLDDLLKFQICHAIRNGNLKELISLLRQSEAGVDAINDYYEEGRVISTFLNTYFLILRHFFMLHQNQTTLNS